MYFAKAYIEPRRECSFAVVAIERKLAQNDSGGEFKLRWFDSEIATMLDALRHVRKAVGVADDASLEAICQTISAIRFELSGPPPEPQQ